MVSGVLITVASRGSPSSAVCTLCLQQRRDACEPRSKGTQGVPVYTKDTRYTKDIKYAKYSNGVSVDSLDTWFHPFMLLVCHAMPAMPATPERHARLHCGLGLMPAHITERH